MNNVDKFLTNFGKYVVKQARTKLTKGKKNATKELYDSISYKVIKSADGVDVQFLMKYYGQFVDKGVSGVKVKRGFTNYQGETLTSPYKRTKQPPPAPLEKWIKIRGLKGRDKATGRFITNKSFAFLIGRSIKNKGAKALMFFQRPLGLALKTFGTDLQVAINKDIQDVLDNIKFNK
jgi:hypothetical protein|tara:strand:+ start:1676 stop:2206 length:531 start_codon:yes stop_codon:yes gene_type:complete